ncbi:DUF2946 family protein [Corticimicrobacter populi]|uniref:DUF2946 domain-containing protein n=1 Tax=Corticimicrobacter populi TaxID=2175229 RepID=A0A2V1JYF9_9BURK|nr:DUF2946 family protein [Corticimicrobacter populi]PWF21036.1 hypothetical protein DD235_16035 [Corticimicrobacter populi]
MLHWCRLRLRSIALLMFCTLVVQGPVLSALTAWGTSQGRQVEVIICNPGGMLTMMIDLSDESDTPLDQVAKRMPQCVFCKIGIPLPMLFAALLFLLLPVDAGRADFPPPDAAVALPDDPSWLRVPVRAPPVFS